MNPSLALFICSGYIALLFLIAYVSDRRSRMAGFRAPLPPWLFTLSISVYCTSWTFYGSVGLAHRSGLEFTAIYIGPTLIFLGWWFGLRKIVRITKQQRLTSIADFISARFGKSEGIALLVTLMALLASTPYIALQLKAVARSYDLLTGRDGGASLFSDSGFWVAAAMALFAMVFGTRRGSTDEHHPGIITAIAFEAVVKLFALLCVGVFIAYQFIVGDYAFALNDAVTNRVASLPQESSGRWFTLLILAAIAILCLPRQFQVTAVEAVDERHFATASWLFPLYLFLMSLFVVPIALAGTAMLGPGANPDLFVITIPLFFENSAVAMVAFIGGFSSATSMVIVSAIALAIMISNHAVLPLSFALRGQDTTARLEERILQTRRVAIVFVLALAFVYYRLAGNSDGLAAMGLIAFAGVAQFFPALVAALFWRQATARGAFSALLIGFLAWLYMLALPALSPSAAWVAQGPFGFEFLRPQAFLGASGLDPVVHATLWSLSLNAAVLILVSLTSLQGALDRLQAQVFVNVFSATPHLGERVWRRTTALPDLLALARQILGPKRASALIGETADGDEATAQVVSQVEQELAATVGAASAHHLVSRISKGEALSVEDMNLILGQTQQALDQARALELKSTQLEETARSLRQALVQVRRLDRFKDAFLSKVSHELRTPMTSLKSFVDVLAVEDLPADQRASYFEILQGEIRRLTSLLDELLDIRQSTQIVRDKFDQEVALQDAITDAQLSFQVAIDQRRLRFENAGFDAEAKVMGGKGRLTQVFINLFSNSLKYSGQEQTQISVSIEPKPGEVQVRVRDNGPGFPDDLGDDLFEAYARGAGDAHRTGTGLGLSISRQILLTMGAKIAVEDVEAGAGLLITIPLSKP